MNDRRSLDAQLGQLESAELVHRLSEDELAYLFRHALVQETAYVTLLKADRKRLHREAGETIERLYAEQLDAQAARLAMHFLEAGDDAKSTEYSTRAGDVAARLYANEEALHHYTRAIEAAKRSGAHTGLLIHLYSETGRLLQAKGQFPEALSLYEEMVNLARTIGDRSLELAAEVLRAATHATPIPTFDPALAQQQADESLELARELGDRAAEARILRMLSLLCTHTSRFPQAIAYGEQSLALVRTLNGPQRDMSAEIGDALENLSLPYVGARQREQSEKVSAQAREIWRRLDNKAMLAGNLGMAAQLVLGAGDLRKALEWAAEGVAISRLIGNPLNFIFNQRTLMMVHLEQGELSEALQVGEETLSFPQMANTVPAVTLYATHVWLLSTMGAWTRAAEVEGRLRTALSKRLPKNFQAWGFAELARVNILRGELEAAEADLASCYDNMDMAYRASPPGFLTAFAASELALLRGAYGRAVEQIEIQIRVSRAGGLDFFLPELLYWKGKLHAAQGQWDEARATWASADNLAERMNMRRVAWQILWALSQLEAERGRLAQAEALRQRAGEFVAYLAAHTHDDLRDFFLQSPRVRAVLSDESQARG